MSTNPFTAATNSCEYNLLRWGSQGIVLFSLIFFCLNPHFAVFLCLRHMNKGCVCKCECVFNIQRLIRWENSLRAHWLLLTTWPVNQEMLTVNSILAHHLANYPWVFWLMCKRIRVCVLVPRLLFIFYNPPPEPSRLSHPLQQGGCLTRRIWDWSESAARKENTRTEEKSGTNWKTKLLYLDVVPIL